MRERKHALTGAGVFGEGGRVMRIKRLGGKIRIKGVFLTVFNICL